MKKWMLPTVAFAILFFCMAVGKLSQRTVAVYNENVSRVVVTYYDDGEPGEPVILKEQVIVLDAGHGGWDPGKVGVSGTLEKDINLQIVYRLAEELEKRGYPVVLTRTGEKGLYSDGATNKKREDMANRVKCIEEAAPAITVSIHQNSYPDAGVHGAQVFYYEGSAEGKMLAASIQKAIREQVPQSGERKEKANKDYYLLTHTTCPIVIVECGFLSNSAEEKLLTTESYQESVVQGICNGIESYLSYSAEGVSVSAVPVAALAEPTAVSAASIAAIEASGFRV